MVPRLSPSVNLDSILGEKMMREPTFCASLSSICLMTGQDYPAIRTGILFAFKKPIVAIFSFWLGDCATSFSLYLGNKIKGFDPVRRDLLGKKGQDEVNSSFPVKTNRRQKVNLSLCLSIEESAPNLTDKKMSTTRNRVKMFQVSLRCLS